MCLGENLNVGLELHTHFNTVIIWGFISEWTLDCSSENQPVRRPVSFYLKGVALLDILRLEVKKLDPKRTKDLKENAIKLYENANLS